jgi:hypothetical protein
MGSRPDAVADSWQDCPPLQSPEGARNLVGNLRHRGTIANKRWRWTAPMLKQHRCGGGGKGGLGTGDPCSFFKAASRGAPAEEVRASRTARLYFARPASYRRRRSSIPCIAMTRSGCRRPAGDTETSGRPERIVQDETQETERQLM